MKKLIIGFFLLLGVELYSQVGPSQPAIGPGGTEYVCASFDSAFYGTNLNEWCWIYEPNTPKLDTAPVIVYWHGYYGGSNYRMLGADMIQYVEHMVKKGYIVIKPVFQYGGSASFSNADGAALLKYAFGILNSGTHVRPSLDEDGNINYGMFGYSNGSKYAFNISNDYATNGIPAPKAIFTTNGNPGSNAGNIPSTTKIVLLAGADDNVVPQANVEMQYSQLTQIPCENKNLYLLSSDYHGTPGLASNHIYSLTGDGTSGWVNSMDWNAVWKFSVGIMDCAIKNVNCDYVFNDVDLVMDMGKWSDDVPINKITIIHPCNPVLVSDISVSPDSITLAIGDKHQITSTILPTNALNKNVTWRTSNTLIARVSTSGLVTAVNHGSAIITATTQDGGKKDSSIIKINSPNATHSIKAKKIIVYPNPINSANMVLNISGLSEGNFELMIFDVQGRMVYSKKQNLIVNDISVKLEDIGSGSYILNLLNNEIDYNEKLIVE